MQINIPTTLAAFLAVMILLTVAARPIVQYLEAKDSNDTIKVVECWKNNIKQDICDKLLGVE